MSLSKSYIRAELHIHTKHSFDAFITIHDLIEHCNKNEIDVITITDHDVIGVPRKELQLLRDKGIHCIKGCEITTDNGAHIIGLFVNDTKRGLSLRQTVDLILDQGGLVYIPHPFKEGSGLLSEYDLSENDVQYALNAAHFIELYNGGWQSNNCFQDILDLSEQYNLNLVAGSDAHKKWHLGRYLTEFKTDGNDSISLKERIQVAQTRLFEQEGDERLKRDKTGNIFIASIRNSSFYQQLMKLIPHKMKRALKKLNYYRKLRSLNEEFVESKYIKLTKK